MKKYIIAALILAFYALPSFAVTFPIDIQNLDIKNDQVYISGYYFEQRATGLHRALDIPCPENSPVRAPEGGTVVSCNYQYYTGGNQQAYGNYIVIENTRTKETWLMAHLQSYSVREGDSVNEGDIIGRSGWTGLARRHPHLHLEKRSASGFKIFFTKVFGIQFRLVK